MMEKSSINWYVMSDPAILKTLGDYIKHTRLQQNKTQQQLAETAGVNRSTLVRIENGGGGTILSLIQLLRSLEQLHLFQGFEIRKQLSPLQLAAMEQTARSRASRKNKQSSTTGKNDW